MGSHRGVLGGRPWVPSILKQVLRLARCVFSCAEVENPVKEGRDVGHFIGTKELSLAHARPQDGKPASHAILYVPGGVLSARSYNTPSKEQGFSTCPQKTTQRATEGLLCPWS